MPVFPSPIDIACRYLSVDRELQELRIRTEEAASAEAEVLDYGYEGMFFSAELEMLSYGDMFLSAKAFALGTILRLQVAMQPRLIPNILRGELCTNEEIARTVARPPS